RRRRASRLRVGRAHRGDADAARARRARARAPRVLRGRRRRVRRARHGARGRRHRRRVRRSGTALLPRAGAPGVTFAALPVDLLLGAFAAAGGAIVALHLVRTRRRRVEVAFAPLFRRVLEERARGLRGYRVRRLLSLLLTLAALACIVAAAG